jgi:hypothetical protein
MNCLIQVNPESRKAASTRQTLKISIEINLLKKNAAACAAALILKA